jgi:PAS domain-containing protein
MGVTDEEPPNGGGPPGSGSPEVPVLTAVQDFDGYTLSINDVHRGVLGWSVDELSAVPFWELVHPDDQDGLMEDRQLLLLEESGRSIALRVRMLCSDGTHCLIRWHMMADVGQERIYLSGVDLSDQELFVPGKRSLVGSWDWDVVRDSESWSEGMFEIYGLPLGWEHTLEVALQRMHPDDRAAVAEAVSRALATGEPYSVFHRILRPDGAVRWLHSAGRVFIGEDGSPQQLRGLTWDVTDRWRSPGIG